MTLILPCCRDSLQSKCTALESNFGGVTKEREDAQKHLRELEQQCDQLKTENCELHNK